MQIVATYFKVYFQINAAFKYDFITLFMLQLYFIEIFFEDSNIRKQIKSNIWIAFCICSCIMQYTHTAEQKVS